MQKITFRKLAGEKYIYPELQGHFIEFLGSCIYDGIWVGEDSEIPNYHGIRKDLVDAFQKLHPPVIRWPGGCFADVYHWRNGIGPREQRPVTYNENFRDGSQSVRYTRDDGILRDDRREAMV